MIEKIKENFKGNKGIISIIIGVGVLLILIFGASYAYFSVNNKNNASASNVQGDFASKGKVSLNTNVSNLYLNLNGVLMNQSNVGTKYYATTDASGTPITNATEGNGIYTLATASMETGPTKYNCTYKYKITANLNSPITDGSDEDIKLRFTGSSIENGIKEYTLKQLIDAGETGIEFTGMFENLTAGNDQTITIESTVENTNEKQDDFAGNRYSINIEPLPGQEGFSCEINYLSPNVVATLSGDTITANITKGDNELDSYCVNNSPTSESCTWTRLTGTTISYKLKTEGTYYIHVKDEKDTIGSSEKIYYEIFVLSDKLIASQNLWQSGLEGDGYRFVGSGVDQCSYDNGKYYMAANANGTCKTLYNYTSTLISNNEKTNYYYELTCPADSSFFIYDCTEVKTDVVIKKTNPNNYVCFGTNNKNTCTSNPNTYMYRMIGVFPDDAGNQHVKLIKYASLPSALAWNEAYNDTDWEMVSMKTNLNGTSFLTNTTYVPNATWQNKIANWKWSAVNTVTYEGSGPNYYELTSREVYLHELNRRSKTNRYGEWTYPVAKIGLMYASDYVLSLGDNSLNYTSKDYDETLKTGWMHITNNVDTKNQKVEWTISRHGYDISHTSLAWIVGLIDGLGHLSVGMTYATRPVFYLNPDVELSGGTGTISDPYLLK